MKAYVAAGLTALAGAALFEAALIPAIVIGGAAVLAPRFLPKLSPLRSPRRRPKRDAPLVRPAPVRPNQSDQSESAVPVITLAGFGLKKAIAKTVTFRAIVTTLDFTTNYVVIGELTTAAGLSTFNLIVGPLFYLAHEAAWNYLGPNEDAIVKVELPSPLQTGTKTPLRMSRALAKTITFRTIVTIMDFTTNYVVVRDVATAAGLSAFGFVLGPFVYLGHEKLWDYYGTPKQATLDPRANPAPAA